MKKLIKTSAFAFAAAIASTSLYAGAESGIDSKQTSNERIINRAAGYLILGKQLSTIVDGSGIGIDVRASASKFNSMDGMFGKYQDNVYVMSGFRYLSGDGNRKISTINQEHDITYMSNFAGMGYMHDVSQISKSGNIDLKVFVGLGIGYSSFDMDYTLIGYKSTSHDESGFHIHYNSGFILGFKNRPELQLELGYQSMHQGSVADEFYVRADYDLSEKLNMPISASTRFDASDSSFSLGAVYHF